MEVIYEETSTVTKAQSKHNTLRIVIPQTIAKLCHINDGEKLKWRLFLDNDRYIIVVSKDS